MDPQELLIALKKPVKVVSVSGDDSRHKRFKKVRIAELRLS